jgi:hypothetical protein
MDEFTALPDWMGFTVQRASVGTVLPGAIVFIGIPFALEGECPAAVTMVFL